MTPAIDRGWRMPRGDHDDERVQLRVLGIAIGFHLIDCPIAHLTAE